jgi:integrase
MASVKKFVGSERWYACYKMPTGKVNARGRPLFKRLQRSTGTTDKDKALQIAISHERVSKLVGEKSWNEYSAQRFLSEISAISGISVGQVKQTESFFRSWLKAKERTAAAKTWSNYTGIIDGFLKWLGPRSIGPLIGVGPQVMAEFRDAEMARGKSGNTVNKALSLIGQVFEEAVNQLAADKNPTKGLLIKNAKNKAQKRSPFSFDQFRELVRRTGPGEKSSRGRLVSPDWQTFILITGYTGGRQQEGAKLDWSNVDLDNRLIALGRTKSGDIHWMPLHSSLYNHLHKRRDAIRGKNVTGLVMPHLAGLPTRSLSKIFRETILPRIGVRQPYATKSAEKGVGRKLAAFSIHSLRHSLSTWLNSAGVSEMMRMRIVGHEDEEVSRGYTHTELIQAATELAKVQAI